MTRWCWTSTAGPGGAALRERPGCGARRHPPVPGARHPRRGRRAGPGLVHQPPHPQPRSVKGSRNWGPTPIPSRRPHGPMNGSRARTADRARATDTVDAEPSPISAATASARRSTTVAGCPGRAGRGPWPWRPRSSSLAINTRRDSSERSCCCLSVRRTPSSAWCRCACQLRAGLTGLLTLSKRGCLRAACPESPPTVAP